MDIDIHYDSDGMFGPESTEGIDVPASFGAFERLVTAAVQAVYPDANIEFHRESAGQFGEKFFVDGVGRADSTDAENVAALVERVWNSDDWVVR